jgi:hypothetical protein
MKKRALWALCMILGLAFAFTFTAYSHMSSTSYNIPISVMSGGGATMSSTSYQTTASVGQSSPLGDPNNPPSSENYGLLPGL